MDWEESVPNIIHKTRRCGIGILSAELGNVDFLPEKKKVSQRSCYPLSNTVVIVTTKNIAKLNPHRHESPNFHKYLRI